MFLHNTVICLMGPTATGKTDLAIALSKHLPCDIVSVDSAMVYRGLDIGAAKPSEAVLAEAPHRLINIREPFEPYSAADFRNDAIREIETILAAGRIPLLVGGTMLYFKALQEGLADMPSANPKLRQALLAEGEAKGWEVLHQRLAEIDPEAAKRIHPNDPQRIQRALEIYELTGQSMTAHWEAQKKSSLPYRFINIALDMDRARLHERIAERFLQMLTLGFVEEVKALRSQEKMHRDLPAMKSVGYRQVWDFLEGELTEAEMTEKAIIATRQFAKRQMTWLRQFPDVHWLAAEDPECVERALALIERLIN